MNEKTSSNAGAGNGKEVLIKEAEGSMFEVNGDYGEFVNTGDQFAEQFTKEDREQLQYSSHGSPVDPKISIYNKEGKIVLINVRFNTDRSTTWKELERFMGKKITRALLDEISAIVTEGMHEYLSPEAQQDRALEARDRVYDAYDLMRKLKTLSRKVREHPLYSSSAELKAFEVKIEEKDDAVSTKLHTSTPDISASYLHRLEYAVQSLTAEKRSVVSAATLKSYNAAKKKSERLSVDNLENNVVMQGEESGFDGLFSSRSIQEYTYSDHSKQYEKYGYIPYLKRLITEIDDVSLLVDERLKEKALVQDVLTAVDLRLGVLASQVSAAPEDTALKVALLTDAKEFVDMLVGTGEVSDEYLYDPKLAARWGQEIVSHMTLDEGIAWAKQMDTKIGYWQSAGQKSSAAGLFAGIRSGLQAKLQAESGNAKSPEQVAHYQERSLELSRLFRLQRTVEKLSPSLLGAHKYHPRLNNAGNDHEFAKTMTQNALGFEGLAFRYMTFELRESDPLSQIVDNTWPGLQQEMQARLGPEGMQKLESLPAYNDMIGAVSKTPQSVSESVARYTVFLQLQSLATGTPVDQAGMQQDIQDKYKPFLERAAKEFTSYLSVNYSGLISGEESIGKYKLTPGQAEALSQLADMKGLGWFDLSDESWETIYMIGKVVGMVAVGIAVGIATGGMSLPAQMASVGLTMTATGVAIEGKSVDSAKEAVSVYGADMAINSFGAGLGRILGGGRYAMQLRNANPAGLGARQIFAEAMKKGGMAKLGQYYDEALGLGARLAGAGVEGAIDATATSWVDTQLVPGTTFLGNLQHNAIFLGFPIGMEFRRDVVQALRNAPAPKLRSVHKLSGKITSEIDTLSRLCGDKIKAHDLYNAETLEEGLKKITFRSDKQVEKVVESVKRLKDLGEERVQLFGDMDRLVHNRLDVMERVGTYDESPRERSLRAQEGIDLFKFEGLNRARDGVKIDFENPDPKYAQAILDAHDIGTPPYSKSELKQKREILLKVFTKDQAEAIIRTRIAGNAEAKIDVDSDEIFDTESYRYDRKDIDNNDPNTQVTDNIPQQKLKVQSDVVVKKVASVRASKRGALERNLAKLNDVKRIETHPTPAPFIMKHEQRVWVCSSVKVDKSAVQFTERSSPTLLAGPATIRERNGKFYLTQFDGSESRPQQITVEVTPEVKSRLALPQDIHKTSVERLGRGAGWKLRMNFNAFNKDLHKLVFRELTYLKEQGIVEDWKFFHGGEMSEGKTSTIYIGDSRKAKMATDYLESLFGDALWQHKNADDIEFGQFMTGRFEVSSTPEVDQYIKIPRAASSGLSSPMEVAYKAKQKGYSMQQKLEGIDAYFAEMYGAFYNGVFRKLPNLPSHLTKPAPPPVSSTIGPPPPPPPRKSTVNPKSKVAATKAPPPPPPRRVNPKSKTAPVYKYDERGNLLHITQDGVKFENGMNVRLRSPGESSIKGKDGKGAAIPVGNYRVEFTKNFSGKMVPTLKPLSPSDTGGNYTVDFRKTTIEITKKRNPPPLPSSRRVVKPKLASESLESGILLDQLKTKSYSQMRTELEDYEYVRMFDHEDAYNAEAAKMSEKWKNGPYSKRPVPGDPEQQKGPTATEAEKQKEKNRREKIHTYLYDSINDKSLHGTLNSKHTGPGVTLHSGYHRSYNGGLGSDGAVTSIWINPHYQSVPETIKVLDSCIGDAKSSIKLHADPLVETPSHNSMDKLVVYFEAKDHKGISAFLKKLQQREGELSGLLDPETFKGLVQNLRIPLRPGISFAERPGAASWDVNLSSINSDQSSYNRMVNKWQESGQKPSMEERKKHFTINPNKRNALIPALVASEKQIAQQVARRKKSLKSLSNSEKDRDRRVRMCLAIIKDGKGRMQKDGTAPISPVSPLEFHRERLLQAYDTKNVAEKRRILTTEKQSDGSRWGGAFEDAAVDLLLKMGGI